MDKLSSKPDVYFGEQLGLTIEEVLFEDVMIHDLIDKGKLVDDCHSQRSLAPTCSSFGFKALGLEIEVPEKSAFKDFQFDFLRVSTKFTEDTWFYIYYNIMSERHQLYAAEKLSSLNLSLHKRYMIWVREQEGVFYYFNIDKWRFSRFKRPWREEEYYKIKDIQAKRKILEEMGR